MTKLDSRLTAGLVGSLFHLESRPLMLENHHDPHAMVAAENSAFQDQAYTFVIISLGLLLLGLAIFPPGLDHITHEAVLEYTREGTSSDAFPLADRVQQELTSPTAITHALESVRESLYPAAGQEVGSLVDRLAGSMEVGADASIRANTSTLHVRMTGTQEGFQYQLLRALLEDFAAAHSETHDLEAIRRNFDTATARLAQALEQLDEAHQRQSDYVDRRLREECELHERNLSSYMQHARLGDEAASEKQASTTSTESSGLAKVEGVNPEWSRLHAELIELQARQQSRPEADNDEDAWQLEEAIRSLEQRLGEIAKFVPSPSNSMENPYASSVSAAAPDHGDAKAAGDASVAEIPRFSDAAARARIMSEQSFIRLSEQIAAVTANRNEALAEMQRCPDPAAVINESTSIAEGPRVVARVRRPVTGGRFLSLLIPSALVGLLCSWFRHESDPPEAFISPEDVEEWLDLPVVGSLCTTDGPPIPAQAASTAPPLVRMVRRSAEVVVGIAALILIYSVAAVSGFGRFFVSDPFTAYTQAVDHLTRIFT